MPDGAQVWAGRPLEGVCAGVQVPSAVLHLEEG